MHLKANNVLMKYVCVEVSMACGWSHGYTAIEFTTYSNLN